MKNLTSLIFSASLMFGAQSFGSSGNFMEAEYLFNINSDFLAANATKALESFFQNLNFTIPSYSVGSNPTVQVRNLKIKVTPKNYQIFSTANGIGFKSPTNIADVEVGTISVNEIIHKEVGGVVADIQVFASCEGVKIKLSDKNSNISGELVPVIDANLISVAIKNPVMELGAPTLDVSAATCTGAQGFESQIKSTLEQTLNNKQLTQDIINSQFLANLDVLTRGLSYKWNTAQKLVDLPTNDNKNISVTIAPKYIAKTSTGYTSSGILRVHYPYPIQGAKQFPLKKSDLSSFSSQNYIIVSDEALLALMQNYFTPQEWVFRETANNFQGFAALLRSRFQQFFVWGDLMKWPKSTVFPLVATMQNVPKITFSSANSVSIQSKVNIDMYGKTPATELEPYVHFQMPMSASLQFKLEQDQLNVQVSNPNLSLKYVFDFGYCLAHHKPSYVSEKDYEQQYNFFILNGQGGCGSINTGVISSAVRSYLNNPKFSFPVPALNTIGGAAIHATSLKRLPEQKMMMLQFGN